MVFWHGIHASYFWKCSTWCIQLDVNQEYNYIHLCFLLFYLIWKNAQTLEAVSEKTNWALKQRAYFCCNICAGYCGFVVWDADGPFSFLLTKLSVTFQERRVVKIASIFWVALIFSFFLLKRQKIESFRIRELSVRLCVFCAFFICLWKPEEDINLQMSRILKT